MTMHQAAGQSPREQLIAAIPVAERRLELAGVSTSLLEGGDGPPVVLLHGPGGNATHWSWVIPDLVKTHRVIAPDLPGQGASQGPNPPLDADGVLAWVNQLIEHTCPSPPVLVGYALGGAIAARFASHYEGRVSGLVLVDSLGLSAFEPAPEFGQALHNFLARPTEDTHEGLWQHCALDLVALRERMDGRWELFEAYNLDRARSPSVQAALGHLMELFGGPAIPESDLQRLPISTSLIWGRHDLATPLSVAEAASTRYGWPLHVIEDCADDPPVEQPQSFLRTLRDAITARAEVAS